MRDTPELRDKYKDRLKKIISTKIQTTMIFPLSQYESAFGHLWGHGKPEDKLNDDEKMFRTKWNEVRNNILNNGNQQKRNANTEIDMYDVIWNGYKTVFVFKSPDDYEDMEKDKENDNKGA